MEEKRTFRRTVSLIIAATLTAISAIFWLNNLVAAINLHRALLRGVVLQGGGSGFFPFLAWSVVDVSTVTTFIFFFGFAVTTFALWKNHREQSYFTRHDRFHIALGLVGTLWGIILIGYYPVADVTIPSLMNCLHTAMFSTLAAIVWVMILEPLVILPWVRFALAKNTSAASAPDPAVMIGEVTRSLQFLSAQLTQSADAAANFQTQFDRWNETRKQEAADDRKIRDDALKALQTLAEITASLEARQHAVAAENESLRQTLEARTLERDDARSQAEKLCRKLDAIRDTLE